MQRGETSLREQNKTATRGTRSRQENGEARRLELGVQERERWGEGPRRGRGWRLEGDWRALQWTGGAPLTLLALASLPRLRFPHLL